jgi:hypothetical protein
MVFKKNSNKTNRIYLCFKNVFNTKYQQSTATYEHIFSE